MSERNAGIKAIKLDMNVNGGSFVVYPAVLWDGENAILVDTGLSGQSELIKSVLEREGVPFANITKIIITHQDRDHIGSLPELVQASGGTVQVLAHEEAVPYLTGKTPLIKSKVTAPPVQVDVTLKDGDVLPYAGGIQVIYTPGHTPDHISLYHIPSKTLITGDALTSQDGELRPFDPNFTLDRRLALKSAAKFRELVIETVIAYHGGVCTGNIQERLNEILESESRGSGEES
ncbi:MBL fold metallo-hydrolase [Paenibacillus thailandensis]|uniref:MBL fold metallo-hydrolase n=1 Tax=Paenibacillus thailandensis TaxID=393250 RepID=A0ABW5QSN1_9BACL